MSDLTLAAIAALAGAAWVAALWYLGLYTHPAVLSWRRLARLRGLADQRPLGDRLGERIPHLRRVQQATNVARLLAIAGRRGTTMGWLLQVASQAGVVLVAMLLLDELGLVTGGGPAVPPGLGLVAAAGVALLAIARLRRRATERQRALRQAVADSLPHLAVMTYHHRVPAPEALLIFARCQRDRILHELLTDESWRRLPEPAHADGVPQSTALTYDRIGQAYGVPMFSALASAVRRVTERGLASQDVYTGLARTVYAERLAEARVAAAQAKTLIVIPMGLMIVPVLVLIGAPLLASLTGIFDN